MSGESVQLMIQKGSKKTTKVNTVKIPKPRIGCARTDNRAGTTASELEMPLRSWKIRIYREQYPMGSNDVCQAPFSSGPGMGCARK